MKNGKNVLRSRSHATSGSELSPRPLHTITMKLYTIWDVSALWNAGERESELLVDSRVTFDMERERRELPKGKRHDP